MHTQHKKKINSNGNKLWDEESTIISIIVIIGKSAIVDNPIFQPSILLNKLIIKPLIANKKTLQIEIPLTDVAIIGKRGDSYCFSSVKKYVGRIREIIPSIDEINKILFINYVLFLVK